MSPNVSSPRVRSPARGFSSLRRPHDTDALDRLRSVHSTQAIYLGEANRRVRREKLTQLLRTLASCRKSIP